MPSSLPTGLQRSRQLSISERMMHNSEPEEIQEKGRPSEKRCGLNVCKSSRWLLSICEKTAPAIVRTALNSSEKSTERLISISPLRHNCPNTMRKQASDAVNGFIAGLLCRATVPSSTTGPFFVSNPALPELAAGAWAFRLSDPTEIGRIVLDCFREHLLSQKPDLKTLEGPPFEAPPYE